MATATHSRPAYTDRNRLCGVGIADPEDLPPNHLTWRSSRNRCRPSAARPAGQLTVSSTITVYYVQGRWSALADAGAKYWKWSGKVQERSTRDSDGRGPSLLFVRCDNAEWLRCLGSRCAGDRQPLMRHSPPPIRLFPLRSHSSACCSPHRCSAG